MRQSFLPRTVIVLSLVSLLNDAASEMIAPILPVFLTSVLGAGPALLGLMEGLAEAAASLLKLASGYLADRGWPPKGLVAGGYGLSNAVRPLMGLAAGWGWVILLRFLDRVGKGLRTAPRDALIAAAVEERIRGRAFGFHRSMDHAGAVVGPLLAFALLQSQVDLRHVFEISVVPGLLLMGLLGWGLPPRPRVRPAAPVRLRWSALDSRVRALVLAAAALALAAAPEAFLVLWATQRGVPLAWVPLIWAAAHVARVLVAPIGGELSDKVGRLPIVVTGWSLRVAGLAALALAPIGSAFTWGLFLAYAATTAFSEGPERALIGDFAPATQKGTAFGLYHMLSGLLALPGGLLFGALWQWRGMQWAFLTSAVLTSVAAGVLVARVMVRSEA